MGIQDREYMRNRGKDDVTPSQPHLFWWIIAGAVLAIFILLLIIGPQGSNRASNYEPLPDVMNVNKASLAELDTLPNVSGTVAQAIIDGRPYASADDLIKVYGIGPKTLERIRPYVRVNDEK